MTLVVIASLCRHVKRQSGTGLDVSSGRRNAIWCPVPAATGRVNERVQK